MAKGHQQHQQRQWAIQYLGKELARRAKSKCELTDASGVPLQVYEVPPVAAEPSPDRCLLISAACQAAIDRPSGLSGQQWRPLAETLWSELPAAQVMAWRLLEALARQDDWAREALENAALDPEIEAWARQEPLVS